MRHRGHARAWIAMMLALALSGCERGSSGRLMPEAAANVVLESESVADDAARVTSGAITMRVFGFWASEKSQTAHVTYRNTGAAPVRIVVRGFAIAHRTGPGGLVAVYDLSGADKNDGDAADGAVRTLYDPYGKIPRNVDLVIPPGGHRDIMVEFAVFTEGDDRVAAGDTLAVRVPMPGLKQSTTIRFTCVGGSWLNLLRLF